MRLPPNRGKTIGFFRFPSAVKTKTKRRTRVYRPFGLKEGLRPFCQREKEIFLFCLSHRAKPFWGADENRAFGLKEGLRPFCQREKEKFLFCLSLGEALLQAGPLGKGGGGFSGSGGEGALLFSVFVCSLPFMVYNNRKGGAEMTRSISDIQTALTPVFLDYDISRAVLFGSVAKGAATGKSDLDLLVDSGLRGLRFVGFMEAVRRAAGMPVDILDVSHIEKGSRIEREILSTGVTIYEK